MKTFQGRKTLDLLRLYCSNSLILFDEHYVPEIAAKRKMQKLHSDIVMMLLNYQSAIFYLKGVFQEWRCKLNVCMKNHEDGLIVLFCTLVIEFVCWI